MQYCTKQFEPEPESEGKFTFHVDGRHVGTLDLRGIPSFTGDVDASARLFFDAVIRNYQERFIKKVITSSHDQHLLKKRLAAAEERCKFFEKRLADAVTRAFVAEAQSRTAEEKVQVMQCQLEAIDEAIEGVLDGDYSRQTQKQQPEATTCKEEESPTFTVGAGPCKWKFPNDGKRTMNYGGEAKRDVNVRNFGFSWG
jgi:hypothetical protein